MNFLRNYWQRIRSFSFNCQLFLAYQFVWGTAFGVVILLMNLYLAELGLSKDQIALVSSVRFFSSGLLAIPIALLLERRPRKGPMIVSSVLQAVCTLAFCFTTNYPLLLVESFLLGVSGIGLTVLLPPFLMENSQEGERTHLFSVFAASGWASNMLGSALGGFLPVWFAGIALGEGLAGQFRVTLVVMTALTLVFTLLLFRLRPAPPAATSRDPTAPTGSNESPVRRAIPKFLLVEILIFLGAGLFMPFMNLYFFARFGLSSGEIGVIFTIGSGLALLATLAAPFLAERLGKVRATVLCQVFSLPLLIGLALVGNPIVAAALYIVRLALMNMSNPLMDSFAMEIVPPRLRVTFTSMLRSTQPLAWAVMGPVAGVLMEGVGFSIQFYIGAGLYALAIVTLLGFFGRVEKRRRTGGALS